MDILGFGITQIVTFLLGLARVGGIFSTAPIFSNVNVAPMVRVSIALALTFVFLPMAKYNPAQFDWLPFIVAVGKEAIIGLAMGFLASLLFTAVHMAGTFIDLQIGFGFAQMVDPMTKDQHAVISQFQNLVATLLFLTINGHHLMIQGLADSFNVLPLGEASMSPEVAGGMMQVFSIMFIAALKIGAPVVGAIFLTDVSLGILARTVPQLNVLVVGFPAKIAVGFVVLLAMLPMAFGVMTVLFSGLRHDLMILIRHLAV